MTAQSVADRCTELGLPMDRATVSKLERGLRQTLTLGELLVLAEAVKVPPIELVFPLGRASAVEALPGGVIHPWEAVKRFTGEATYPGNGATMELFREHDRLVYHLQRIVVYHQRDPHSPEARLDHNQTLLPLARLRQDMVRRGLTPPPVPPDVEWLVTDATQP